MTFGGPAVMPPQAGRPESRRRHIVRMEPRKIPDGELPGAAGQSGAGKGGTGRAHVISQSRRAAISARVSRFGVFRERLLGEDRSCDPVNPHRTTGHRPPNVASLVTSIHVSDRLFTSSFRGEKRHVKAPGWLPAWAWILVVAGGVGLVLLIRFLGLGDGDRLRMRAEATGRAGDWSQSLRLWRRINAGSGATAATYLGRGSGLPGAGAGGPGRTRACGGRSRPRPGEPEAWLLVLKILRVEDRPLEAFRPGMGSLRAPPAREPWRNCSAS